MNGFSYIFYSYATFDQNHFWNPALIFIISSYECFFLAIGFLTLESFTCNEIIWEELCISLLSIYISM